MRIFGRKANQRSITPTAPGVPPELQQYYGQPSLGTRFRRVGLFVLPVLAAVALIAALIAGGVWLKHSSEGDNHKIASSQSTAHSPAQNNSQSQRSSGPQSQSSSQNQPTSQQQPSNSGSSTDNASSANGTSTNQLTQTAQSSDSSDQISPSNIPSTGPDASMYLVALVLAIAGTVGAYFWQLRRPYSIK